MELRCGTSFSDSVFFVLVSDDIIYMWEDGFGEPKWVMWPENWGTSKTEPCSEEYFESITGHSLKKTMENFNG